MFSQAQFQALDDVLTDLYVSVAGDAGQLTPEELKVILDGGTAAIAALCGGLAAGGKIKPGQTTALLALDANYREQLLEI